MTDAQKHKAIEQRISRLEAFAFGMLEEATKLKQEFGLVQAQTPPQGAKVAAQAVANRNSKIRKK